MALLVWLPLNGNLNNNGIFNSTVTNSNATVDTSGKIGLCYSFNGSSSRISVNSSITLSYPITICGWAYPTNVTSSTTLYILSYNTNTGGTDGHTIGLGFYGNAILYVWAGGNLYSTGYSLSNNKWYHICATINEDKLVKVYANGTLIYSTTCSANPSSSWLTFGARCNSSTGGVGGAAYYFSGKLNDIRVYDECLSDKLVKEISKGLVLHYPLNLVNRSANLLTGTSAIPKAASIGAYYTETGYESTSFFGLAAGDTYTYSIKLTAPSDKKIKARILFYNSSSDRNGPVGNWIEAGCTGISYITATLTTTQRAYSKMLLFVDCNDGTTTTSTCYYSCIKLEKGLNTNPQWCPSTSDAINWGTTELDCSGYGYHGTIAGSITGNDGSARNNLSYFWPTATSAANTIHTPTIYSCGEAITMSIWIKTTTVGGESYLMPFESNSRCYCEMSITSGGQLRAGLYVNGTRYVQNVGPGTLLNGNWHHIAITYDGTTINRYIDGVAYASTTISGTLSATSLSYWLGVLGTDTAYYNSNIYESDARLYATALSAEDIKLLYNSPIEIANNGSLMTQGEVIEV